MKPISVYYSEYILKPKVRQNIIWRIVKLHFVVCYFLLHLGLPFEARNAFVSASKRVSSMDMGLVLVPSRLHGHVKHCDLLEPLLINSYDMRLVYPA